MVKVFVKRAYSDRLMFDFASKTKEHFPDPTEKEKELLLRQYSNNIGGIMNKGIYSVCAKRTEYRCIKIDDGIFREDVYNVSNKMDTSKPKDRYFLVEKGI